MGAFKFGLAVGFSLIIAIGAQNIFLMRQGVKNDKPYLCATLCFICDCILIALSITSISKLMLELQWLHAVLLIVGVLFLCGYGGFSIFRACRSYALDPETFAQQQSETRPLKTTILLTLSFSLLNPHAIIDSVILLGSTASQYQGYAQKLFMAGTMTASLIWFFVLVTTVRCFQNVLSKPRVWQSLEFLSGSLMVGIAAKLACQI